MIRKRGRFYDVYCRADRRHGHFIAAPVGSRTFGNRRLAMDCGARWLSGEDQGNRGPIVMDDPREPIGRTHPRKDLQ